MPARSSHKSEDALDRKAKAHSSKDLFTNRQSSRQLKMKTKDKLLCTKWKQFSQEQARKSQRENKEEIRRSSGDFFSLYTQLFWWPVWYLVYSPDVDTADSLAPSTFSLSFSTERISHSQNPPSTGLALCDSDALTYFDTNWYSVEWHFFFLYIHLLNMPPVLREVFCITLATSAAAGGSITDQSPLIYFTCKFIVKPVKHWADMSTR